MHGYVWLYVFIRVERVFLKQKVFSFLHVSIY